MHSGNSEKYRIVAISNPRSGRNKRGGFERFNRAILAHPAIHHLITHSEADLVRELEQCKKHACQILVVNGGDGTLLKILTYLKLKENLNYDPMIVLLKAGTTSMAYGDVGCKGRWHSILSKTVEYISGNSEAFNVTKRHVLRMTLVKNSQSTCGLFFGAGAIYNGILYCRQNLHTKGVRGEFGPSLVMIRYLFDWLTTNQMTTSSHAQIQVEQEEQNEVLEGDFTIVTATTLKRLLMGVYPFWATSKIGNDVAMTLIKRNAPKAKKAFMKILLGKPPGIEMHEDYYRSTYASKVVLNINDGFTLDGELFGEPGSTTQVELESAGEVKFLTK